VVVGDVVAADQEVEIDAEVAGEDGRSVGGTAEDGVPADEDIRTSADEVGEAAAANGLLAVGGVSVVGCGPAVEDGEEQAAGATATASAVMTATATTMGRRRRCGVVVMEPSLDKRGIGSARRRYRSGIGRLVRG
jgi:hypothetical protein